MITLERTPRTTTHLPDVGSDTQVIGLGTARLSGIKQSRDAYVDVLRTFRTVDVNDWSTAKRKTYKLNLFASAMSTKAVEQVGPLSGKTIWCLVLESTKLPPKAMEAHDRCDQLWVPTRFVEGVCLRNGMSPDKVRFVPYYMRQPARRLVTPSGPFTALVSWDGRSSMNRKFVLGAIQAFKMAWPEDTEVRLRLKTRDLPEDNVRLLMDAIAGDSRIQLDNRFVETADDLFDGVHAILHIHRAEGFGRHLIEAMQRRIPVIATAYSGNMDWMTQANALLVNYDLVDTAQKEFQYPQGGKWAEPHIDHAAFQLRYCRDNYNRLGEMLDLAQQDVFRVASIERSRHYMINALQDLGV